MKRVTLILLFGLCSLVSAQSDSKRPALDLQTFVITGREKIELPSAEKLPSPAMEVINEEFLNPSIESFFVESLIVNSPFEQSLIPIDTLVFYRNKLIAKAGNKYLPSADYSTFTSYKDFTGSFQLLTEYKVPFVANSWEFLISPKLDISYKIVDPESMFDKNKVDFSSGYESSKYAFYSEANPDKRQVISYHGGLSIQNSESALWRYKGGFDFRTLKVQTDNYKENCFSLFASSGFNTSSVEFTPSAKWSLYSDYDSVLTRTHKSILFLTTPTRITVSDVLGINASANLALSDSIKKVYPNVELNLKLQSFLSFTAGYARQYKIYDFGGYLENNKFVSFKGVTPSLFDAGSIFKVSFTLESAKVYDLTLGFENGTSDNYLYYVPGTAGRFNAKTLKADVFNLFADLRVHPSEYGYLISQLKLNSIKDTSGNYIPNNPVFSYYAAYGYVLQEGITLKAGTLFLGKRYTTLDNSESLPYYFSLFCELGYSFSREFLLSAKIDNLLNRKNYLLKGYQDRQMTFELGLAFQW